jgi:shikimate dehydrogenase
MITGTTRLFAVIGHPIAQVRAPSLMNPLFEQLRMDAVLVPVHARPENFDEVIVGLQRMDNLDGMLITVPHKISACRFADELSPTVRITGSTNALRRCPDGRWLAENFDGAGFVNGLSAAGRSPAGKRVSLVGGGGAGSAIAVGLLDAGVAHLSVCDRDQARLGDLLERLETRWPGRVSGSDTPDLSGADLAVNATPLGLRPDDPLPFAPRQLRRDAVVADIIMQPRETKLLREAGNLGLATHPGISMLTHQVDFYRGFFDLVESAGR